MSGPSKEDKSAERAISQQQVALAQSQDARASQLHNLVFPGMEKAEDYYTKLASGDPTIMQRVLAPAVEQITAQSDAAKERIKTDMPAGGEQRLAMENSEIAKSSNIGRLTTSAYTSAFPALASLAGTGIGLSANEVANAISAFSGGAQTRSNVANQDAQAKAATMGFAGSLVGAGGAAIGCWIARLLYGDRSWKVNFIRAWLGEVYSQTFIGSIVVWLYGKTGKQVAAIAKHSWMLQSILRPIFDRGLVLAVNHYGN